jgi:hypothetical protein
MNITKLSMALAVAFGLSTGIAYAQDVNQNEIKKTTPGAQQPQGSTVNKDELSDRGGQSGTSSAHGDAGSAAAAGQDAGAATAAGDQMQSGGDSDRSAGAGQGGQGTGGAGGKPGAQTTGQGEGVKESGGTAEAKTPEQSGKPPSSQHGSGDNR